jgi:hypothetical protein
MRASLITRQPIRRIDQDREGRIFATAASGPWQTVLNNLVPKDVGEPRIAAAPVWRLNSGTCRRHRATDR